MTTEARRGSRPRVPLSRERVLRAAVKVADEGGVESLTMRRLAEELDAEAMSLYYHVARKEDVLDGLVDVIAAEINDTVARLQLPAEGPAWKAAMRNRILSARQIFLRHPWAPAVFASRETVSPQILRYYDGVLAIMKDGGFSYDTAHHALHALGSRALGFSQELFTPGDASAGDQSTANLEAMAGQFPHLIGMLAEVAHDDPDYTLGWCDDQAEFEFGLDLILDGLDRLRPAGGQSGIVRLTSPERLKAAQAILDAQGWPASAAAWGGGEATTRSEDRQDDAVRGGAGPGAGSDGNHPSREP